MKDWDAGRAWLVLFGLQCLGVVAIYHGFLSGSKYFAFYDIGSDTFFQFVPMAMHLAEYFRSDGFPGWSFQVGVGANLGLQTDPFLWLAAALGPEAVLRGRIWIFVLKLVCAGGFFFMGLRALGIRAEAAIVGGLAYSFCGYLLIDGQWDPSTTEAVFFALLFWGIVHLRRGGGLLLFPLAVAFAAMSGPFMPFAIAMFLGYAFLAELIASEHRGGVLRGWITRVLPLALLGALLAAPIALPSAIQLLDSPRGAGQANLLERMGAAFWINAWPTLHAQLAGFWHKSLLGIGSQYKGFVNFFEAPGFYAGVLPLLVLAQLWRGEPRDRRWLLAGLGALIVYVLFPAPRLAVFAFSVDYFRMSTLWVTMLVLVLAMRALSLVLDRGVDRRMLAVGAGVCVLAFLAAALPAHVSSHLNFAHALKMLLLLAAGAILLWKAQAALPRQDFAIALMAFVVIDAASVGWFDVNARPNTVTRADAGYADATLGALGVISRADPGIYRVEKTYMTVSHSDALAQGYRGVKSYYYHGSGVIDFHIALGLIPARHTAINYTNWLHGPGPRFSLYSLLGVKYLISRGDISWPGFQAVARGGDLVVYANENAFPLGIVQYEQLGRERFNNLPFQAKDAVLMRAVVTQTPVEGLPEMDPSGLDIGASAALETDYVSPARRHQREGLKIEQFSNKRVTGTIQAARDGVLVFSIPDSPGWNLYVDGVETQLFRANLGMIAAKVAAGSHRIEIVHQRPGAPAGLAFGAGGLLVLLGMMIWRRVRQRATQMS